MILNRAAWGFRCSTWKKDVNLPAGYGHVTYWSPYGSLTSGKVQAGDKYYMPRTGEFVDVNPSAIHNRLSVSDFVYVIRPIVLRNEVTIE